MIVQIILFGVFVLLGIIFYSGKGAFLIAGFNTMPKEEREKYDTVALCKFMGKIMFAVSFVTGLQILSDVFEIHWLFIAGVALTIIIVIFALIHSNTGNRFKK